MVALVGYNDNDYYGHMVIASFVEIAIIYMWEPGPRLIIRKDVFS